MADLTPRPSFKGLLTAQLYQAALVHLERLQDLAHDLNRAKTLPERRRLDRALTARKKDLSSLLAELHPSDIADFLERLPPASRPPVVALLSKEVFADVLAELSEGVQESLLEDLPPEQVAHALTLMDSDDAADVVQNLSEDYTDAEREAVTDALTDEEQELLAYPEDSAGGIMQLEALALPADWTVAEVLEYIRTHEEDLPYTIHDVFVVTMRKQLLGAVPLTKLVRHPLTTKLRSMMEADLVTVQPETPQDEVAQLFEKYDLFSCAVTDERKKLLGVITLDDILDVVIEEHEHAVMSAAGLDVGEDLFGPVAEKAAHRLPWLFINVLTAIMASAVVAQFSEQISKLVALAVLMPIVTSMGGNAGTQTLTVTVRGLAMGQLTAQNAFYLLRKEFLVGGFNGLILALCVGFGAGLLYWDVKLGLVMGAAVVINHLIAALAGSLVPLSLEKIGKDPAVSSGVLVTMFTDVGGFLAFLGLSSLFLL